MKRKIWIIVLLLSVVLGCAFCFREALAVRLFPKVVLTGAIGNVFEDLESRFENSPVALIAMALDPKGCQQITMKLDTETQLMGVAHYDLDLRTQTGPNRVSGHGTVSTGAGLVDLNLYLDEDFAALASERLTEGAWYGITYDSFPADIRGFRLLGLLLGEDILNGWDRSVDDLANRMGRSYSLPSLSAQDLRTALLGALALKPMVEGAEGKHCYSVTFTARGPELAQKARPYLNQAPEELAKLVRSVAADPDSRMKLVFHLKKRKLTALDVSLTLSGMSYDVRLAREDNQLRGELIHWDGENLERTELTLETLSDEDSYREKLISRRTVNGLQSQIAVEYSWDLSSGDMVLEVVKEGRTYPIRLNLKGEGQTITVSCRQFEQVLSLINGKEQNRNTICAMTITHGEPVPPVEDYKNLSDWSAEDLYLLIDRVGSLVGIKLP